MDSSLLIVSFLLFCFPLCILLNFLVLWNWRSTLPLIIIYIAYAFLQKEPIRISLPYMQKAREYFPAKLHGSLLDERAIYVSYPHGTARFNVF